MADYELIRRLGAGMFGEVWLVVDRALGIERAVKFVRPEKIHNPTNFYNEPKTLKALEHPNIVRVEDAGTTRDGRLYLAMEVSRLGSLEDVYQGGVVPLRKAVAIVCDVCRGLQYAHDRNFVHRDVKPANILIADNGTAKLSDFGLATRAEDDGTASGYGYVAHLAPEVIADDITNTLTDIYAVGITLYRLINGDSYLPTLNAANRDQMIRSGQFPNREKFRPFIPKRLKRAVLKAIAVDPDDRYRSANELRHALEQLPIKCDWTITTTKNGTAWTAASSTHHFRAEISQPKSGSFDFELQIGRSKKTLRRSTKDCKKNMNLAAAQKHVRKVLDRLTIEGK